MPFKWRVVFIASSLRCAADSREWMTRRLKLGEPAASLPLLHYVLLGFSHHVATAVAQAGYEVGLGARHHSNS